MHPVVLEGASGLLREFRSADARAASAWVGDPDAVQFVPLGPLSAAQAVDYVEQLISEAKRNPREGYTLAVVERSTGDVVGSAALGIDSRVHRRAEIGYILRASRVTRRALLPSGTGRRHRPARGRARGQRRRGGRGPRWSVS